MFPANQTWKAALPQSHHPGTWPRETPPVGLLALLLLFWLPAYITQLTFTTLNYDLAYKGSGGAATKETHLENSFIKEALP